MLNLYAIVVLVARVGAFALALIARLLDQRAMKDAVPTEFQGLYDADAYAKAQRYARAKGRLGSLESAVDLTVLLGFWALSGFEWLDEWVRHALPTEQPELVGITYLALLFTGSSLLGLPFRIYSTFVIEERFGFNKTTPATFVSDLVKGTLLSAVLGLPLMALVLWFFRWGGDLAWAYAWVTTAVFMIAVQYVVPTWIMPLFNRFTPLPEGELRQGVLALSERVDFPLSDVLVIDGSRRSSKANAFFTGFGKRKRIALFDTLIAEQSTQELLSVLAHEVGHYQRGHILKGLILGLGRMGVTFFLLGWLLRQPDLYAAFGVQGTPLYVGFVLFGLVMTPLDIVTGIVLNWLSRRHEFEADEFAAKTVGSTAPLISGLKKLSVNHLANLTPHPLTVALNYSHPPVLQRIQALRKTEPAP